MKRLSVLCLVAAGVLYSAAAFASVCFLADTKCQEGKYQITGGDACRDQNSSWIHESKKCNGLIYGGVVCNDATGNYYEEGSCPEGYIDFSTLDQDKYECKSGLLCNKCCLEVTCQTPYQPCEKNAVPTSYKTEDVCQEPDGTIKYRDCECPSQYAYTCKETGITTSGDYCVDGDGDHWTACQCASGYIETTLVNIKCPSSCTNGCSDVGDYVKLPGSTTKLCWEGATCRPDRKCTIVYQSDFDNFWQGYDVAGDCKNLTVDCNKLGYDTGTAATGVKCKDGTEPYRCPFDHEAVYCESGIDKIAPVCEFNTETECKTTNYGSTCIQDASGCWNPNACKSGYGKTVSECAKGEGDWSVGEKDPNNCGKCQCANTCNAKIYKGSIPENATAITEKCYSCQLEKTIITGWKCNDGYVKNAAQTGCELSACADGYARDVSECGVQGSNGWTLGTKDTNGCGKCTEKSCSGDPEKLSVSDCGDSGDKGWDYSSCYYGDELRGTCKAKDCPTGSQSAHCGDGYTEKTTEDYSGNSRCYSCEEITCPSGYDKTIQNASQCGSTGADGWIVETKDSCGKCTAKTCKDHGLGTYKSTIPFGSLCKTKEVYLGDSLNKCQDCIYCEDSGVTNPYNLPYTQYKNCNTVCSATDSAQDIYETYVYYTAYEANGVTTKDGKTGSCFGWVNTEGVDGSCCCYEGGAVALADCSGK